MVVIDGQPEEGTPPAPIDARVQLGHAKDRAHAVGEPDDALRPHRQRARGRDVDPADMPRPARPLGHASEMVPGLLDRSLDGEAPLHEAHAAASYRGKYRAMVAAPGLGVAADTTNISSAEIRTIGTTGMKPKIAVPPGVRARKSKPASFATTTGGPGAGAGTTAWNTATAITATATHSEAASPPHFVLPRQNGPATSSG